VYTHSSFISCVLFSPQTLEEKNSLISTLEASLAKASTARPSDISHSESLSQSRDDSMILPSTPGGDVNDKDVLKVYMKNQLELQETEWEQYEETINGLAEQLEGTQDQLSAVQTEKDAIEQENVSLQEEIDRLKVSLATKVNEVEALANDLSKSQCDHAEASYELSRLKSVSLHPLSFTSCKLIETVLGL
jgi:chromosome segregation ATPase